jgi:hypothetical protein
MQYVAPLLALFAVICWVVLELIERSRVGRLLAGGIAIAFTASAGFHLGRFAEWNRYRLYPHALIEIAKQIRQGEAVKVEAAITQVFESGSYIDEVAALELIQALYSDTATGASQMNHPPSNDEASPSGSR